MTWLTGTTTWGELDNELTKLICGEKASSGTGNNAATVGSGNQWVREETRTITGTIGFSGTTMTDSANGFTSADVGLLVLNSNVPGGTYISAFSGAGSVTLSAAATTASSQTVQLCTNTIRTPSSQDIASGNCSTRTGYFANCVSWNDQTAIYVSSPFTSTPTQASSSGRWIVTVNIQTANTVASNYSTIVAQYQIYDVDTNATSSSSTLTFNSSGVATVTNGLQITVSSPTGIVSTTPSSTNRFIRGFTTTYMYGIDPWPMLYRAAGSASFSVNPPGTSGTDYDIVQSTYGAATNAAVNTDRSNMLNGLGIKTSTGLGGNALYTYSFNMALAKIRIYKSSTQAGMLALDLGGSKRDNGSFSSALTNMRNVGGLRMTSWCQPFQTPTSVTNSAQVQYWISVTSTGIVLALNGDPGFSGKLSTTWVGKVIPTETTYDKFPIGFGAACLDFTADQTATSVPGTQYTYVSQKNRQASGWGSRDWQTSWGSCGHMQSAAYSGMTTTDKSSQGADIATGAQPNGLYALGVETGSTGNTITATSIPARQTKPGHDGNWWLYQYQYGERSFNFNSVGSTQTDDRLVRGTTDRFFYIPDDGWVSGDELTDTVTGNKYLLLKPDYIAIGHRMRSAANTYWGGIAIAEI